MESTGEYNKEEIEFGVEYGKMFFTSDPHYGHNNVIRYCDRPFKSVKEMEKALIENYNKTVPEDGICIWLGDCFFAPKSVSKRILRELNGRKILVMGNHDKKMTSMMNLGFDFACYGISLNISGKPVRLSHYPWQHTYDEDFKYYKRCPVPKSEEDWLIHGHVHEKWKVKRDLKAINVGVDVWDFKPVSWVEVEKIIQKNT